MIRHFRFRLMAVLAAAIAVGVTALAVVSYTAVARSLRSEVERDSIRDTELLVSQLGPARLPPDATAADVASSGLGADLERTTSGYLLQFDDGGEVASGFSYGGTPAASLAELVRADRYGLQWTEVGDGRAQVLVGARQQPDGPTYFLYYDAEPTEAALETLARWLATGAATVVVLGTAAAYFVSRPMLRPVRRVAAAARRAAAGDLAVTVPVESDDEIGDLAESFNHMTATIADKIAQLEAAEAVQRGFVADVSHELRTPVTALVHEADLLSDVLRDRPDTARLAHLLARDVHRLRRLVEDLLEISRLDAGVVENRIEPVDLRRFLSHVVTQRRSTASLSEVPAGLELRTDLRRLERIVGNLVDNALAHAGDEQVCIDVTIDPERARCRLTIADRGPGITPGHEERIFDRFVKHDDSRHGAGSGLGLAIAREHARSLGGDLVVRRRDGGGAAFVLELPLESSTGRVTESLPGGDTGATSRRDGDR